MQDYASCETLDSVSTLQGDSDTPELRQRPVSMVSSTGMVFQETDAAMAETENLIKNSYEAAVQALGTTGTIIVGINEILLPFSPILSHYMIKELGSPTVKGNQRLIMAPSLVFCHQYARTVTNIFR